MKVTSRLRSLAIAISLVFGACGAPAGKAPTVNTLPEGPPDWFPNGDSERYPPGKYLSAVGACGKEIPLAGRASCAAQNAREQIVLQIKSEVTARRESSKTMTVHSEQGSSEASVSSTFTRGGSAEGSLELEDTPPVDQLCTRENDCYALVVLDREKFVGRLRSKNAEAQAKVASLVSTAQGADLLLALKSLGQAEALAVEMSERSHLISVVSASGITAPSVHSEIAEARLATTSKHSVCLISTLNDVDPESLFAGVRKLLGELGFQKVSIGKGKGCKDDTLRISFEGTVTYRVSKEISGAQISDIRGHLSVEQGGETVGGTTPVAARGVSRDGTRSKDEAVEQVSKAIEGALLGLISQ